MALLEFFGCLLIAFGPPIIIFLLTVAKDPVRVIVLMTSAFFWLISLLLSALLWFIVVPLREHLAFALFFSVLIQEAFRYLFYILISKAEKGLMKVQKAENKAFVFDMRVIANVSGLGFGIISGAFSLVNVLNDMNGPGTVGINGESQAFFLVSALLTLCFTLLHTCWGVIFFLSLSNYGRKSMQLWIGVCLVIGSHLLASGITLINDSKNPSTYIISVVINYTLLALNASYSLYITKNTLRRTN